MYSKDSTNTLLMIRAYGVLSPRHCIQLLWECMQTATGNYVMATASDWMHNMTVICRVPIKMTAIMLAS